MTHSKSILKVTMAIVLAVSFTSCGNGQKQGNENVSRAEQTENPSPATNTVSEASVTASLLDAYLGIKNALVKDDQAAAAEYGSALAESTGAFEVGTFAASEQQELEEILEVVKEHGEHIAKSDIGHQREHFEALGKDIKDLVAIADTDRDLYQQYCPMYNNNTGGMWLSASDEVLNPLFGSKMLNCGSVQETIESR